MSANRENFDCWFKNILEPLYEQPGAGFAILMIALPLLERYLREKSKTRESRNLKPCFYVEFREVFPVPTVEVARQFWQVYRHGLLHQAAPKQSDQKKVVWMSSNHQALEYDSSGHFYVNAVEFARKVIQTIEAHFETFEGPGSASHKLYVVHNVPGPVGA